MPGGADLARDEHIQRRAQPGADLGGDRNPAAGQPQHDRIDQLELDQPVGQLPASVTAVPEPHRAAPPTSCFSYPDSLGSSRPAGLTADGAGMLSSGSCTGGAAADGATNTATRDRHTAVPLSA